MVTLKVIMEESKLRRETLRYSFMQFKKPFDIVLGNEFRRIVIEIKIPLWYTTVVGTIVSTS